jgi:hypothetical protein
VDCKIIGVSRTLELVLGGLSIAFAIAMVAAVPWAIRKLPADYFVRPRPRRALGWRIVRNVAGIAIVVLGVAMLVLPGQGVLTVLLGLSILDLKTKDRALAYIFKRPRIAGAIQRLRTKAGRPPLLLPA